MTASTQNTRQFAEFHRISMTSEKVEANKNAPDWKDANHYKVTLRRGGDEIRTYYSQGFGIQGEPEVAEVLDSLASDASTVENATSFEDWAGELGYDPDSRKAEQTYKACKRIAGDLRAFLGKDLYSDLLWHTERL